MIPVAVIGAGSMGRIHLRVLRELPDVDLVAVADTDAELAQNAARLHGIRHYADYRRMLERERPAAVTVAVPTGAHHDVGLGAIAAGCHVMVEKPIAPTLKEADELVAAAARSGHVLMVGHVERYNPAVVELKRRLRDGQLGRIFHIHCRRLGPFPERIRDVGVVLDLATHDLDIMRYLVESDVTRLFAEISREVHHANEDMASAILRFQNDAVGLLEVSWLTPTKIRDVTVTGERGMLRAEYLTQDLYYYENAHTREFEWEHLQILRGVSEGAMTRVSVPKQEPLRLELRAFIDAINGDAGGIVSGADGLIALRLALAVLESGRECRVVELERAVK